MRLTKTVTFAFEMARHCLPLTPTGLALTGLWMQMNMETPSHHARPEVLLLISIYGAPSSLSVSCSMTNTGNDWTSGTCTLHLTSRPDEQWSFQCDVVDGKLVVVPITS